MVELLKQVQYAPLVVERQIAIIFAGTQGHLDDMPIDQIRPFEEFLFGFLDRNYAQVLGDIANKKELSDDLRSALGGAIDAAKVEFIASRGIKAA